MKKAMMDKITGGNPNTTPRVMALNGKNPFQAVVPPAITSAP
jgi:hypothetical protein